VKGSPIIWRLVDSGEVSPEFSAAADEAILNARVRGMVPNTVHLHVRQSPTISLGCNSPVDEFVQIDQAETRKVKIIRRCSGGSAIYTDLGQLIFSIITEQEFLPKDIVKSYEKISSAIIYGLSKLGINAKYKPINDITAEGLKISGSAQLRRGKIVLHHGTVLIDTDLECMIAVLHPRLKEGETRPPRVGTLSELLSSPIDMEDVKQSIIRGISHTFKIDLNPEGLCAYELNEIDQLVRTKYGSIEWNFRL